MLTKQEQLAYFPLEEWEDSLRQEEMMDIEHSRNIDSSIDSDNNSSNCKGGVCSITPEQLRLMQQLDDEDERLNTHPF